jgi:hypothetical protein
VRQERFRWLANAGLLQAAVGQLWRVPDHLRQFPKHHRLSLSVTLATRSYLAWRTGVSSAFFSELGLGKPSIAMRDQNPIPTLISSIVASICW